MKNKKWKRHGIGDGKFQEYYIIILLYYKNTIIGSFSNLADVTMLIEDNGLNLSLTGGFSVYS